MFYFFLALFSAITHRTMAANEQRPKTLVEEMEASVKTGDLVKLQSQLAQWEADVVDEFIIQKDHLLIKPHVFENIEVYRALHIPYTQKVTIEPIYYLLNHLLIQSARKNQVHIIKYILDERQWLPTPGAAREVIKAMSFDVLESFLSRSWDINQPYRPDMDYPPLMFVLAREEKVRWCLEHGANPNAQYKSTYRNLPTFAGGHARLPILQLLYAHEADFRRSNAFHRSAENNRRVPVLQWLLDEVGVPINQRELEYDPELFYAYVGCGTGTALHCAAWGNALDYMRFLLERGVDINLLDTRGHTARDKVVELGRRDAVALLDGWKKA